MRKPGSFLQKGDVVDVWWAPRKDTIVKLEPYDGKLGHIFTHGVSTATFASGARMTIDYGQMFEIFNRED